MTFASSSSVSRFALGVVILFSTSVGQTQSQTAVSQAILAPALTEVLTELNIDSHLRYLANGCISEWLNPDTKTAVDEPINLILRVRTTSAASAMTRLQSLLSSTDYRQTAGHTNGYAALVGGKLSPEVPSGDNGTYADGAPFFPSDHVRFFQAVKGQDNYYYILAAASREGTSVGDVFRFGAQDYHTYDSFKKTQDDLKSKLVAVGASEMGLFHLRHSNVAAPLTGVCNVDGPLVKITYGDDNGWVPVLQL